MAVLRLIKLYCTQVIRAQNAFSCRRGMIAQSASPFYHQYARPRERQWNLLAPLDAAMQDSQRRLEASAAKKV
jgi:hypothetical protein